MKAKVSGQFQGAGGKQSIEIDGSVEIVGLSELFVKVKELETRVVELNSKLEATTLKLEALLEKEEEKESKEEATAQEKASVDAAAKKPTKKS